MINDRNRRKKNGQIREFFNKMSIDRDKNIIKCPILNYEQEMRQKAVIELLNPSEKELILDVGCGNARDIEFFSMIGAICVGIDISKGMISEAKEKTAKKNLDSEFLLCDATKIPFKNNIFDKVLCSETIEHIPNWEKTINEIQRILKKDGLLVITTPNMKSLYGLTKITFDFVGKIFNIFIKKRKIKKHPYDIWKTQIEVLKVMRKNGFIVKNKMGICFILGHWTYKLPNFLKKKLVKFIDSIENKIKNNLTSYGYIIGISARSID